MSGSIYLIRNQLGQYFTRSGEWVDGREPSRVLKARYQDEALNQLVELNARDIDLRGEVIVCELSEKGEPLLEASEHLTPTLAEQAAAKASAEKEAQNAQPEQAATEEQSEESRSSEPSAAEAV